MTRRDLHAAVREVVAAGNCSGCGACSALSPTITMQLDGGGFLRPHAIDGEVAADAVREFRRICPGVRVTSPAVPPGGEVDPVFGPYVSVWAAWATDDEIRWRGSSGGVLTALSAWMLENGVARTVIGAGNSPVDRLRTVPVAIRSRTQLLDSAGSRYAPVGNVELVDPAAPPEVFVGKPCEADAARRLLRVEPESAAGPVVLSFFCAGVPSQKATVELAGELGVDPQRAESVRYRGRGWPGEFVVTDSDGRSGRTSYEKAWGQRLGRQIQDRCKICPDGTGMHADIAVGDFWETDDAGYPRFTEGEGVSVAIARTRRGHDLLLAAQQAGAVGLRTVRMHEVAAVQPSQVRRRVELAGRLLGRRAAGRPSPQFRGFRILVTGVCRPRLTLRAAKGTFARMRRN
jgi:coenzyme F420 hydrogenase subunit beta